MNLDELQGKLIQVARAHPPGEHVPYGFERRVMAAISGLRAPDQWALWAGALWRAAAPCVAIVMLLAAWSLLSPAIAPGPGSSTVDVAQELENPLLAAADQEPAAETIR